MDQAGSTALGWPRLVGICVVVLLATIVVRFIWVYPATYVPRWLFPPIARADPAPSWRYPLVLSWAGMRGVVTLAAAFALPLDTPQRPVLVLAAFSVVAGTLIVQGATLPKLVRWLRLRGPDPAEDALVAAEALQEAALAGAARLDELAHGVPEEVVARLRDRTFDRANWAWERLGSHRQELETPSQTYRRLRIEMLAAERAAVADLRRRGRLDEDVLRELQKGFDLEESVLERIQGVETMRSEPLRPTTAPACSHLAFPWPPHPVPQQAACPSCIAEGTHWVHLRMCVVCGVVGCCDSSPRRHATAHYTATAHPVIRSIEPGEEWRWCYLDERIG
jgi:CPA1 family monovalent cation:H+ antiporter